MTRGVPVKAIVVNQGPYDLEYFLIVMVDENWWTVTPCG